MKSYIKINKVKLKKKKFFVGDKSISHRIIICCFLKTSIIEIKNFLESNDLLSTLNLFKNLGIYIYGPINNFMILSSLKINKKNKKINFIGNSGTTIRISLSLISKNNIIVGDKSLNKRTMYRIIKPLTIMGYIIQCKKNFFTPIIIYKKKNFGLKYNLVNISSQIKSCFLLSSINSYINFFIIEKKRTRDHSERLLLNFKKKTNNNIVIPNDSSSIAFLICYYLLNNNFFILKTNFNKLRIGFLEYLILSKIKIVFLYKKIINDEHIVKIFFLKSIFYNKILFSFNISKLIDEIPILLIYLIYHKNRIKIYGLEELKFKESNRLSFMIYNIKKLGIRIIQKKNYIIIKSGKIHGNFFDTKQDHRLFMSMFMCKIKKKISNAENILSSFPFFFKYYNNKNNNFYVYNK